MNARLDAILTRAVEAVEAIQVPRYLSETVYPRDQQELSMDKNSQPPAIYAEIAVIDKPIIAFVGAYSSGKTFLVNYLTGTDFLSSQIDPTTAVITVLRHISDRPSTWKTDTVFALKSGSDPRTLDPTSIEESGSYADLKRLTTYAPSSDPSSVMYDAVVVFLESDHLSDKIVLDCPGVGTLTESSEKSNAKTTIREMMLQRMAMQCSDGFVVLSAVSGNAGVFGDNNTRNVLVELSSHAQRFPATAPHANILMVASQADPRKKDLQNQEAVLQKVRKKIFEQCANLPKKMRDKLDPEALSGRVVLFYKLDSNESEIRIQEVMRTLKRTNASLSSTEMRKLAEEQFAEDRGDSERFEALDAALRVMINGMKLRMDDYRLQHSIQRVERSISHFEDRQMKAEMKAILCEEMHGQSKKYHDEQSKRETAWTTLGSESSKRCKSSIVRILDDFDTFYFKFSDADFVKHFICDNYRDDQKEQATLYLPGMIERELSDRLQANLVKHIGDVETATLRDLEAFDKTFLKRKDCETPPAHLLERINALGGPPVPLRLETFSALGTFSAITAGIAGSTMLAAGLGSALAQAALAKVLIVSIGAAGAFGLGGALSGLLAGVPLIGWTIAGAAALVAAWRFFGRSWQTKMADAASKSIRETKNIASSGARVAVTKAMGAAEETLAETLKATKVSIDAHVVEVHAMAAGEVAAADVRSAAEFYRSHLRVLSETLESLKV